jgi:hypothetical protein
MRWVQDLCLSLYRHVRVWVGTDTTVLILWWSCWRCQSRRCSVRQLFRGASSVRACRRCARGLAGFSFSSFPCGGFAASTAMYLVARFSSTMSGRNRRECTSPTYLRSISVMSSQECAFQPLPHAIEFARITSRSLSPPQRSSVALLATLRWSFSYAESS